MPKALKSRPKSNKSPNLVTLIKISLYLICGNHHQQLWQQKMFYIKLVPGMPLSTLTTSPCTTASTATSTRRPSAETPCRGKSHHKMAKFFYPSSKKIGPFRPLFLFCDFQNSSKKIEVSDGCIRTLDRWYQKRPLYQLCHNHCPLVKSTMSSKYNSKPRADAIMMK